MSAVHTRLIKLLFVAALLAPLQAYSLPDDSQKPIEISADSAIKDDKQGVTIYQGAVKMSQGTLLIEADKVTIYMDQEGISKIVALGKPARFQQQPEIDKSLVVAEANTINYSISEKLITLTDSASLSQEGSSITGNSIAYDINAGRIEAGKDENSGEGRVNVVIPPPPATTN